MPVSLHAAEHPIHEVFSNRFVYTIPHYQRPYAWTSEQAGLLVTDLLAALGTGDGDVGELDPYFLGSIVLIKEENKPSSSVVDGQQRLTTLVILLSVFAKLDALRDDMTKEFRELGWKVAALAVSILVAFVGAIVTYALRR